MPDRRAAFLLTLSIGLLLMAATSRPDVLRIGNFSGSNPAETTPPSWQPLSFQDIDNRTDYRLVRRDSTVVMKATSDGGASGLVTRQRIDPMEYPVVEWRWKVNRVLDQGNAMKKSGDDYPARLYITFDYDGLGLGGRLRLQALKLLGYDDLPTRALNYIWASTVERGRIVPNPYTDWVMMVPVQSGRSRVGRWVREQRNIVADYRAAFGENPPPINGVAIMTDTDNTGESATAYYGDIVFKRAADTSSTLADTP
jgi:hypothetical protein